MIRNETQYTREFMDTLEKSVSVKTLYLQKPGETISLDKEGLCYMVKNGHCQLTLTIKENDKKSKKYNTDELTIGDCAHAVKLANATLELIYVKYPTTVLEFSINEFNQLLKNKDNQPLPDSVPIAPKSLKMPSNEQNAATNIISPIDRQKEWGKKVLLTQMVSLNRLTRKQNRFSDLMKQSVCEDLIKKKGILHENITYSTNLLILFAPVEDSVVEYLNAVKIKKEHGYYPITRDIFITSKSNNATIEFINQDQLLINTQALSLINQAYINVIKCLVVLIPQSEKTKQQIIVDNNAQNAKNIRESLRDLTLFVKYGERDTTALKSISSLLYSCQIIFDHLGLTITLPDKKKLHIDINDLDAIATEAGFRHRKVKLNVSWWKKDQGPLLVHLNDDDKTPGAIIKEKKNYYLFLHKNLGKGIKVDQKVAMNISEEAYYLYPAFDSGPLGFKKLLSFSLKSIKYDLIYLFVFSLIGGAIALVVPLMSLYIVNLAIPDQNMQLLTLIIIMLVTITLTSTVIKFIIEYANLRIDGKLSTFVEPAIIDRIIQWPIASLNESSTALIFSRIAGIMNIKSNITKMICVGIPAIIFLVYALSLTVYLLPTAGILLIFILLLFVAIVIYLGLSQFKAILTGERMEAGIFNIIYQSIENIKLIRSSGIENRIFRLWSKGTNELNMRSNNAKKKGNVYSAMISGYSIFMTGTTFIGIAMMKDSDINIGIFIAFINSLALFFMFSSQIINTLYSSLQLLSSLKFSKPILAILPEKKVYQQPAPKLTGAIQIDQVYLKYRQDDKPAIKYVEFDIKPGDFVGIVGKSGSGKSTLLKLLLGIYQTQSGGVYYDGMELKKIEATSLRKQCGVILQTSKLFAGSIYENIVIHRQCSTEKVWQVLNFLGLGEEIKQIPMQLHTIINETSTTFSSGQIQRILLARALVNDPKVLFLDEPTNFLDNYNAQVVHEVFNKLDDTRIIVSHNPAELTNANKIIVLQQGEMVEMGTYNELAGAPNSVFNSITNEN